MTGGFEMNQLSVGLSKQLLETLEEHHDLIVDLYQNHNYSSEEIAIQLNTSKSSIERYRRFKGIERLYKDRHWLKARIDEGLSQNKIAQLCGCSPGAIARFGEKFGYYTRGEKRQLVIHEDYFASYNKKSCYWAGFINADGHLAKDKRQGLASFQRYLSIVLSTKDIDHLRKFNKELSRDIFVSEHSTTLKGKEHHICRLKVARQRLCEDLNQNFDIAYGEKSLHETISSQIPKEFLRDFMRGHFDGDGSITYNEDSGTWYFSIVGGKEFCYQYKAIIDKEYGKDIGVVTNDSRNENMYYYRVTSFKDLVLVYLFLYYRDCTCLERKRDTFKQIISDKI